MNTLEQSTLPRFFELIKERKITAKQVSDATGIPQTTIANWRKGVRNPKHEAIVTIASYLNVPVKYLMGSETDEEEDTIDLKIQAEVKQLSDQQKADVLKYIRFVQTSE